MEKYEIKEMLQRVAAGETSVDEAMMKLKTAPFEEIGIASLDHHRGLRQGTSEIIYGASKTPEQIETIARTLYERGQKSILITRMKTEAADRLSASGLPFTYYETGRIGLVGEMQKPRRDGYILVATGGTSDI